MLFDFIVFARILIAQRRLDEANALLERLLELANEGGRTTRSIEILNLQALALQGKRDIDLALSKLEQALTLGEPEGFIRIFVDEGPPMARLLHEALSRDIASGYVTQLLAAFGTTDDRPQTEDRELSPSSLVLRAPSAFVEPLSEREVEVLQLIAEGLSNREIASRLYLSLNTVKAHTRNIYGKIDVHSRTQAVARAQELGLL